MPLLAPPSPPLALIEPDAPLALPLVPPDDILPPVELPADMPLAPKDPVDPVPLVAPIEPLPAGEPELADGPEGDPESPQFADSSRHAIDDGTAAQSQSCFMVVRLGSEKEVSFAGIATSTTIDPSARMGTHLGEQHCIEGAIFARDEVDSPPLQRRTTIGFGHLDEVDSSLSRCQEIVDAPDIMKRPE